MIANESGQMQAKDDQQGLNWWTVDVLRRKNAATAGRRSTKLFFAPASAHTAFVPDPLSGGPFLLDSPAWLRLVVLH